MSKFVCYTYMKRKYTLISFSDKCSIEADTRVSTHPYFLDTRGTPPALATLSTLYVERCHHCWKEPEVNSTL